MTKKKDLNSFESYKSLTSDQKEYVIFDRLGRMEKALEHIIEAFTLDTLDKRYDERYALKAFEQTIKTQGQLIDEVMRNYISKGDSDKNYATKLTEKIVFGGVGVILITVLGWIMAVAIIK